jgi:hypothetical protein
MLLFLHAVLSTYDMVLAHLNPNTLLTQAIFQYLCEAFIRVRPSVTLFRVFFEARLDARAPSPAASPSISARAW